MKPSKGDYKWQPFVLFLQIRSSMSLSFTSPETILHEVLYESLMHNDINSFENRAAVIPSFQLLGK